MPRVFETRAIEIDMTCRKLQAAQFRGKAVLLHNLMETSTAQGQLLGHAEPQNPQVALDEDFTDELLERANESLLPVGLRLVRVEPVQA